MLALVVDKLISKEHTCVVPTRSIHSNFHLIRYIIVSVGNEPATVETLINLNHSKAAILSDRFRSDLPQVDR